MHGVEKESGEGKLKLYIVYEISSYIYTYAQLPQDVHWHNEQSD